MIRAVVASSVLMAFLRDEPLSDKLLLSETEVVISSVNLAEIFTKLLLYGTSPEKAWSGTKQLIDEVIPFTEAHAKSAGSLVATTRNLGLSFGDRACLALGLALNLPVYTADKAWREIEVGVKVLLIR